MKLNNLLGNTIMAVMVILGLASCKKPVYYNISASVQPAGGGSVVVTPSAASVLEGETLDYAALARKTALKLGYTRMGSNVTEGMKRGIACALKTKRIRKSGDTYRR